MMRHSADRPPPIRRSNGPRRMAAVVLATLTMTGCGRSPPVVQGTVTLDGATIDAGTIMLIPADGKGPTAGTGITAGRYRVEAAEGPKRVRINSFQKDGTKMLDPGGSGQMIDRRVESIPSRYNEMTELTVTVKPGLNNHNFALEGSTLRPDGKK
jgi:hypothetical protein